MTTTQSRFGLARDASKSQLKARVAIDGPTGAGKTWTALVWAFALCEPGDKPCVIDTEHGSAEWYSPDFPPYRTITWAPPYNPLELAATIKDAERAHSVVVIDSVSHFWEGEGGTLDIVDAAAQRSNNNSYAGWKVGTPALRHLVDTILQADAHVIATMRSKMEYVLETNAKGQQVPKKVGMAPIMRQGVEYEFTLIADMDLEHRFIVTKSRCSRVADLVAEPHRAGDVAQQFRAWLDEGSAPISEADAQRLAEALNAGGQEARAAWLERFSCRPTALPEGRLAEANQFVAQLGGQGTEPTNVTETAAYRAAGGPLPVNQPAAPSVDQGSPDDDDPTPPPDNGSHPGQAPTEGPGDGSGSDGAPAARGTPSGPPTETAAREAAAAGAGDAGGGALAPAGGPADRGVTARQVASKAQAIFAVDYNAAPRGSKGKVGDRLRHALVWATTGGRTHNTAQCTGLELLDVWHRLDDLEHGRLTYTHGATDDNGGVTFTSAGNDTTVLWSEFEASEAAA
jgi:hypothetical protein